MSRVHHEVLISTVAMYCVLYLTNSWHRRSFCVYDPGDLESKIQVFGVLVCQPCFAVAFEVTMCPPRSKLDSNNLDSLTPECKANQNMIVACMLWLTVNAKSRSSAKSSKIIEACDSQLWESVEILRLARGAGCLLGALALYFWPGRAKDMCLMSQTALVALVQAKKVPGRHRAQAERALRHPLATLWNYGCLPRKRGSCSQASSGS